MRQTTILVPVLTVSAAVALSGCISIQKSEDPNPQTVPTATETVTGTVTPSPKDPEGTASGSPVAPKDTAADDFSSAFEKIAAHATETVNCRGAEESLEASGKILRLEGGCEKFSIRGDGNMIAADNIGALSISGNGNIVAVKSTRGVEVAGLGNSVGWLSQDTTLSDHGEATSAGPQALNGIPLPF